VPDDTWAIALEFSIFTLLFVLGMICANKKPGAVTRPGAISDNG
jgi:hypothetical protein